LIFHPNENSYQLAFKKYNFEEKGEEILTIKKPA